MEPELDVESLVRRHQHGLWRYCRMLGAGAGEAEELVQDAFLVVLRKGFRERDERATASFLRRSARFLFLDRRRRRRDEVPDEAVLDAIDASFPAQVETERHERFLDALARCVGTLQGRAARAIELFYRRQLPRAEVANELGMVENGVKTLLQRTRAVLRACIEREVLK